MSQTGHDPPGYNPVTYLRHNLGAISLAISVNTDTSNQLINVSNRTRSTRLQSRDLSTPQPWRNLVISYWCQYKQKQSIDQCLKQDTIQTILITNGYLLQIYR